jgi:hypothetical protein
MRTLALLSVLSLLAACERIDFIELEPADVVFKQPNNQQWMQAKAMARNGVRAVKARVVWSVGDESVAKVDAKGLLTPVGDGETEVIARIDEVEARVPVHVIYVDKVEVEPKELVIVQGSPSQKVTIKAFRKNGKLIEGRSAIMSPEDKNIARVAGGEGEILGLDPGSTTVSVQVDNAKASFKVTVVEEKTKK